VSNEAIVEIAEILELHPSEVHDTMTFYAFFKGEGEKLGTTRVGVPRAGVHAPRRVRADRALRGKLGVHCGHTTPTGRSRWSSPSASARATAPRRAW
jgi:NADH-quinone oxidoreductase subunit E